MNPLRETNGGDDRVRNAVVATLDALIWPLAFGFTAAVEEWPVTTPRVMQLAVVGAVAQVLWGMVTHLYRRRFQTLSFSPLLMRWGWRLRNCIQGEC